MIEANNQYSFWDSLLSDEELKKQIPEYPRLAHGVKLTPYKNGLALYGGDTFEVFEGFGIRQTATKLIPLLDGTRNIESLKHNDVGVAAPDVLEILANLFMSGLLRNGPLDEPHSNSLVYLDRLCGNTGFVDSGQHSMKTLLSAHVVICLPKRFHEKIKLLYGDNFAQLHLIDQLDWHFSDDCDFLLVINDQTMDINPSDMFATANNKKVIAMNVELSGENARFGPMILPQRSASYACYRKTFDVMTSNHINEDAAKYWISLAIHSMTIIIAGMSAPAHINSITDYIWGKYRQGNKTSAVPRLHGWDNNGDPYDLEITEETTGYDDWLRYSSVALQLCDYSPPNTYHMHYKAKNIESMYKRPPALYTADKVKLYQYDKQPNSNQISIEHVSHVLNYSVGYGIRDNRKHRYAPTGGNLGSTLSMVIVNEVEGLEKGIYWFDSYMGYLEKVTNLDEQKVNQSLGIDNVSPMVIISLANVFKVAQKYSAFSFNISWYDSGVMYAYLYYLSDVMNLEISNLNITDQSLSLAALKLPEDNLLITGIMPVNFKTKDSQQTSHSYQYAHLLNLIKKRQAYRQWASEDMTMEQAQSLASNASQSMKIFSKVCVQPLKTSMLLILKLSDGTDGFYTIDDNDQLVLKSAYDREFHYRVLSQSVLTRSPAILLPQVDLADNLKRTDDLNMAMAYRFCGSVIGDMWLQCGMWNMAGTACGGCFEGEVRSVTGEHGLASFNPLAFCIGPK